MVEVKVKLSGPEALDKDDEWMSKGNAVVSGKTGCNGTFHKPFVSPRALRAAWGTSAEKVRGSLLTPAVTDGPWGLGGFGFGGDELRCDGMVVLVHPGS